MEDVYELSDAQIQKRVGAKLRAARLKQNVTQESLAASACISRSSLQKIESGEISSFDALLRVLRTLGLLENIYELCKEEQMSPSEYYKFVNSVKGNKRMRAVGNINKLKVEESEW